VLHSGPMAVCKSYGYSVSHSGTYCYHLCKKLIPIVLNCCNVQMLLNWPHSTVRPLTYISS
jgi:hypothetical protein